MKKLEVSKMENLKGAWSCTEGVLAVAGIALGGIGLGSAVDKGLHCIDSFLSRWY